MTTTASQHEGTTSAPRRVPPFCPDPRIIGNIEGNKRIQRHDREAAQRYLDEQQQSDQTQHGHA